MRSNQTSISYGGKIGQRFGRRHILLTTLIAIVGISYILQKWGGAIYERVSDLYWQREFLRFEVPECTVAYEEEPLKAADLLISSSYIGLPSNLTERMRANGFPNPMIAFRREPALDYILPSVHGQAAGVLFMHQRVSPSGNERLVILPLIVGDGGGNFGFWVSSGEPIVLQPLGFTDSDSLTLRISNHKRSAIGFDYGTHWIRNINDEPIRLKPRFRWYCGQPDPANSSHFTIRFEYTDREFSETGDDIGEVWRQGMFHGFLRDDDTVIFRRDSDFYPFGGVPTLAEAPVK